MRRKPVVRKGDDPFTARCRRVLGVLTDPSRPTAARIRAADRLITLLGAALFAPPLRRR